VSSGTNIKDLRTAEELFRSLDLAKISNPEALLLVFAMPVLIAKECHKRRRRECYREAIWELQHQLQKNEEEVVGR
jgi:hypothetical protein